MQRLALAGVSQGCQRKDLSCRERTIPSSYSFCLFSRTGGNSQLDQPLVNGGTDTFGIVLWEVVNARTNVDHPAALQSASKALGEGW